MIITIVTTTSFMGLNYMSEKIVALGRNILIERMEKKKQTETGLLLLDKSEVDDYAFAKVISCQESYFDEKLNKTVYLSVKPGDTILYKPESAMKIEKDTLMIIEDHIFAIVE
jgi:co-chaperonin GroES (HSP10)